MWRVLPNRSQPGLHTEPLDVTIGQLLAPYFLGASALVINGSDTTSTHKKLLALWYITVYAKLVKKTQKQYSNHFTANLLF